MYMPHIYDTYIQLILFICIVQVRIVWTLGIRDAMFNYVVKYMDYFSYTEASGLILKRKGRGSDKGNPVTDSALNPKKKEKAVEKGKRAVPSDFRVRVNDQHGPNDTNRTDRTSSSPVERTRNTATTTENTQLLTRSRSLGAQKLKGLAMNITSSQSTTKLDSLLSPRVMNKIAPSASHLKLTQSRSDMKVFLQKAIHQQQQANLPQPQTLKALLRRESSTLYPNRQGRASTILSTSTNRPHDETTTGVPPQRAQHYFIVEMIDSQINFLDTISHSSLLIVSSRSRLEGKCNIHANLASLGAGTSGDIDSMIPKCKNIISVHMKDNSAYTVSSLSSTHSTPSDPLDASSHFATGHAVDTVYWVNDNTPLDAGLCSSGIANSHANINISTSQRPLTSSAPSVRHMANHINMEPCAPNKSTNSTPVTKTPPTSHPTLTTSTTPTPTNLEVAIKKFTIVAEYLYWNDVTTEEARKMYLDEENLTVDIYASFKLDLPDICLDIVTTQFYVSSIFINLFIHTHILSYIIYQLYTRLFNH